MKFTLNLVHILYIKCKPVNLKKTILFLVLICLFGASKAQKVDSIFFSLYTDSLKKGTYNYISVDGKCNNGRYLPLDDKTVEFSCPEAKFEGNNLIIPAGFKGEKVTITAKLKSNPAIVKQVTIYIKTKPDGPLKTAEELMREMEQSNRKRRNG